MRNWDPGMGLGGRLVLLSFGLDNDAATYDQKAGDIEEKRHFNQTQN